MQLYGEIRGKPLSNANNAPSKPVQVEKHDEKWKKGSWIEAAAIFNLLLLHLLNVVLGVKVGRYSIVYMPQ